MPDKPDNPQAFAAVTMNAIGDGHLQEGMTLRDYFAGQSITDMVAVCNESSVEMDVDKWAMTAREAYALADAMLTERAKNA